MTTQVQLDGLLPVIPTPFGARSDILFDDISPELAWALERSVLAQR